MKDYQFGLTSLPSELVHGPFGIGLGFWDKGCGVWALQHSSEESLQRSHTWLRWNNSLPASTPQDPSTSRSTATFMTKHFLWSHSRLILNTAHLNNTWPRWSDPLLASSPQDPFARKPGPCLLVFELPLATLLSA